MREYNIETITVLEKTESDEIMFCDRYNININMWQHSGCMDDLTILTKTVEEIINEKIK